jgi:hypothetical protein
VTPPALSPLAARVAFDDLPAFALAAPAFFLAAVTAPTARLAVPCEPYAAQDALLWSFCRWLALRRVQAREVHFLAYDHHAAACGLYRVCARQAGATPPRNQFRLAAACGAPSDSHQLRREIAQDLAAVARSATVDLDSLGRVPFALSTISALPLASVPIRLLCPLAVGDGTAQRSVLLGRCSSCELLPMFPPRAADSKQYSVLTRHPDPSVPGEPPEAAVIMQSAPTTAPNMPRLLRLLGDPWEASRRFRYYNPLEMALQLGDDDLAAAYDVMLPLGRYTAGEGYAALRGAVATLRVAAVARLAPLFACSAAALLCAPALSALFRLHVSRSDSGRANAIARLLAAEATLVERTALEDALVCGQWLSTTTVEALLGAAPFLHISSYASVLSRCGAEANPCCLAPLGDALDDDRRTLAQTMERELE